MKFRCDARTLRTAVSELTSIVRPDPKTDVRPAVSLGAHGNRMTLRVCDLQGAYYAERELTIENLEVVDWEAVADLAELNNILSVQLDKIELELHTEVGFLRQGKTELSIPMLPYKVLKIDPPALEQWYFNDETEPIVAAVSKANRHRDPNDDPRYAIVGIAFQNTDGYLEIVGTDGVSLSAVKTDMKVVGMQDILVVRPDIASVLSTYEKGRSISLAVTDVGVWIKQSERLDLIARINETYPKYQDLVDENPVRCGTISNEELTRIKSVVQRGVVGTTDHGCVWLKAVEGHIHVWGRSDKHVQAVPTPEVEFPSLCMMADNLVSVLNMFNQGVDVALSNDGQRLFLSHENQFAIMFIEEVRDEKQST